jgi:hypothetical protein
MTKGLFEGTRTSEWMFLFFSIRNRVDSRYSTHAWRTHGTFFVAGRLKSPVYLDQNFVRFQRNRVFVTATLCLVGVESLRSKSAKNKKVDFNTASPPIARALFDRRTLGSGKRRHPLRKEWWEDILARSQTLFAGRMPGSRIFHISDRKKC